MKNITFSLIALSSAATALFAFTTPDRNMIKGNHSIDTSSVVRIGSLSFNDTAMVRDTASFNDTSVIRDSAKFVMDSAMFRDTAAFSDTALIRDTAMFNDTAASVKDTAAVAKASNTIKGKVFPIDAATEVWAISGTDSLKVSVTDGAFTFDAKPGTYKIVVVAKVPFKDVIKDGVQVADGNLTDLGTIRLQQ